MTEYNRIAAGNFISTGAAQAVVLPFVPDFVEITNVSNYITPTANKMISAIGSPTRGNGFAAMTLYNGSTVFTTDVVTSNGFGFFTAGTLFQFGPQQQVIGATKANPIVFNVANHGYNVGDIVMFEGLYQTATTGMPQICGMPFIISAVGDANHFSVVWNATGSNYTALSGSPVGAWVKKVLFPFLYAPGISFIEAIVLGSPTQVVTTTPHNLVVGSEVAFRIPPLWGTTQLNSLPNNNIPGSPIYGYVNQVVNNVTVNVTIDSTAFAAFNPNIPVASVPGLTFPQLVAVGDVNSGGAVISPNSNLLYPPPVVNGINTINGPAINGAFVNNTRQGFIIGNGVGITNTTVPLVGAANDIIIWRAYLNDILAI